MYMNAKAVLRDMEAAGVAPSPFTLSLLARTLALTLGSPPLCAAFAATCFCCHALLPRRSCITVHATACSAVACGAHKQRNAIWCR